MRSFPVRGLMLLIAFSKVPVPFSKFFKSPRYSRHIKNLTCLSSSNYMPAERKEGINIFFHSPCGS